MHARSENLIFSSKKKNISTKKLEVILSEEVVSIVGYEPYLSQIKLDTLFSKDNNDAKRLVIDYLKECDVNVSNNLGMTFLHTLIWADRGDLAKLIIETPAFDKINFKFCIPVNDRSMYASALDLAIAQYMDNSATIDLEFIELLLKHGAIPPNPNKKFLSGEFASFFYPHMVMIGDEQAKPDELKKLLCLLHRYNLCISTMEKNLQLRLFDTDSSYNDRAIEFADKTGILVATQQERFVFFMSELQILIKEIPVLENGALLVEMTEARLSNGEDTVSLPFDHTYRPCCIM